VIVEAEPEKRAPEPLRLVQQFLNSVELDEDDEELGTPEALRDWLAARDLIAPGTKVTTADLRRAIDVREGLRALLYVHNGGDPDPKAVERLERAAAGAPMRAGVGPDGSPRLVPAGAGAPGGLAELLAIVSAAAVDGTWSRLKACADEGCRWAFYDRSKNRSGRWCSMEVCGNQQKARAYRERRRTESRPERKARS
jgi:predicted RNA-binding Zn ribbon-like protein